MFLEVTVETNVRSLNKRARVCVQTTGPQNSFCFGNPAALKGPVAFRPTIARGLALSAI